MPTATRKLCLCDDCSQNEDNHPQYPDRKALSDSPPGNQPDPVKLEPLPIITDTLQTPLADNTDDGGLEDLGVHKVARDAKDLTHLGRTIDQRLAAFDSTTIQGLQFLSDPLPDTPYISQFTTSSLESRTPFGLKSRHAANAILINFEAWLIRTLQILKDIECHGENPLLRLKECFVEKVTNALRDVDDIKRHEWERQQRSGCIPKQEGVLEASGETTSPLTVDTYPFTKKRGIDEMGCLSLIAIFIVAVLNILCTVSRDRCNFVLAALRLLLEKALQTSDDKYLLKKTLSSIPKDVRSAISPFQVTPSVVPYVCCPKCSALYLQGPLDDENGYPEICDYSDGPADKGHPPCGARLRVTRIIHGNAYSHPICTYLYQDLPTWVGHLVSRPGFEALLDKNLEKVRQGPKDCMEDIWDSPVVKKILGPDGKSFFSYEGSEGRLLFSLSYDGFNPYSKKRGGKQISLGVIFMVCLNLPPEIRHKVENVYLVGIIPGPKQPELQQINHFIRPLVSHLEIFYSKGFFLSATHGSPQGRTYKGAFIPLVCDLPAARHLGGLGNFSCTHFCTFCGLLIQDRENVNPGSWPKRSSRKEHREFAEAWRDASPEDRVTLFNKHGTRWTEFSRLPYWHPLLYTLFDTMHGWYLNDFKTHITDIWAVDLERPSGDGLVVHRYHPSKNSPPTNAQMVVDALNALKNEDDKALKLVIKSIFYRLCEAKGLRRGGTSDLMCQTLKEYYAENPAILYGDIITAKWDADIAAWDHVGTAVGLKNARYRLTQTTTENKWKEVNYLAKRPKPDLERLCEDWEITLEDDVPQKRILAERLVNEQLRNPRVSFAKPAKEGTAVLGADTVSEIDADIARTVLPSWVAAGPRRFSSSIHGSLKAEEWRTTCMIRLAITLPRIWSPRGDRHTLMLENFMHLLTAVKIGASLVVVSKPTVENGAIKSTGDYYREEYGAYLRGLVDLYPTSKIHPNTHIAYHVGELLDSFGPTHAWRAFFYERLIQLVENIPNNAHVDRLNQTLMMSFCMGSNFKALMNDSRAPDAIKSLTKSFQSVFNVEATGTMLHDLLGLKSRDNPAEEENCNAHRHRLELTLGTVKLLVGYLNSQEGTNDNPSPYISSNQRLPGCILLEAFGWNLTECRNRGTIYRRTRPTHSALDPGRPFSPHQDSHALINAKGSFHPVSIQDIFSHRRKLSSTGEHMEETFCIVRRYAELTSDHQKFDGWSAFPLVAGRLYYDKLEDKPEVVSARELIGHFAKTPFKAFEVSQSIGQPCIHVLPLDWHFLQQQELTLPQGRA